MAFVTIQSEAPKKKSDSGSKKKTQKRRRPHQVSSGIPTARGLLRHLATHPTDGDALKAIKNCSAIAIKAVKSTTPSLRA